MSSTTTRKRIMATNAFDKTDLDAFQATTAQSRAIDCRGYRHIGAMVRTKTLCNGTITFFASNSETRPDFTKAVSDTNLYFPIELKNSNNDDPVVGATGIAPAGTDIDCNGYRVNRDDICWLGVKYTQAASLPVGSVLVQISGADNN